MNNAGEILSRDSIHLHTSCTVRVLSCLKMAFVNLTSLCLILLKAQLNKEQQYYTQPSLCVPKKSINTQINT